MIKKEAIIMDMYQKRKIRKENKKNNTQENSTKSSFNW